MVKSITIEANKSRFEVVTIIETSAQDVETDAVEETDDIAAEPAGKATHNVRRFPARAWCPVAVARKLAHTARAEYPGVLVTLVGA